MAAIVEVDESNGATETVTHAITGLAMGTVDAPNMTAGAAGARQAPSSNGMAKMLRFHMTALGGGLGITDPRVYCDPATAGWSLYTNAHTNSGSYSASKLTSYLAPDA